MDSGLSLGCSVLLFVLAEKTQALCGRFFVSRVSCLVRSNFASCALGFAPLEQRGGSGADGAHVGISVDGGLGFKKAARL